MLTVVLLISLQSDAWSFIPKPDSFSANAVLDLRSLNEKTAGENGWIKVSKEGDFETENGKSIRFWAVNTNVAHEKPFKPRPRWSQKEPNLDTHARFLAKRGVNLIRLHSQIAPSEKQAINEVNQEEVDYIWRAVASMKKQGIYTLVSPYWMVPTKIPASWGIAGGEQSAAGLLFFDPTLQKAYKGWLRKLLAEKNPYTGIPLSQDPALAMLSIQNEDSLLFWTVNSIQGEQKKALGKKFFAFALKKYGTESAMKKAWSNNGLPGDSAGVLDFHNIWEMTQKRSGGMHVRLTDQLEFWSKTMYDWNAEVKRFVREDLKSKVLLNATNWKTADGVHLNDAERWSYTACEVDAVNHYVGGIHKGPNEGWSIDVGDKYTSPTAILDPKMIPVNLKQTVGRPMTVTESMWVMPNANAVEAPFFISSYSSLNGVDAYFWFATGDEQWSQPQSANGYNDGQQKWMFGSPDVLGQFPAAAFMFRKGLIRKGNPVVIENRKISDIFERRTPLIAEESSFDPNRDSGDIAPASNIKAGINPLAFLLGPVEANLSATSNQSTIDPLVNNLTPNLLKSVTGEVELSTTNMRSTVNSPKAQAAVFARPQLIQLADVSFNTFNQFGAAYVVSLDDAPIKSSGKILVQIGTRARPTGWREKPTTIQLENKSTVEGFQIENVGTAPWRLDTPKMTVTIKNPGLKTAKILNENLEEVGKANMTKSSSGVILTFPSAAMYVVLEK